MDIVDVNYQLLDEPQENTAVQQWLMAHCAEYGFILRYPTDKCNLTGVLFSDAVRCWLQESVVRVDAVTLQGYLAEGHILPYFDALGVKLMNVDRRYTFPCRREPQAGNRKYDGKSSPWISVRQIVRHGRFFNRQRKRKNLVTIAVTRFFYGGDKRDRTADLLNAIQALSQLSYTPRSLRIGTFRSIARKKRFVNYIFSLSRIFLLCLDEPDLTALGKRPVIIERQAIAVG